MSRFQGQYPVGAIREQQEIIDLVKLAKSEHKEITIYAVTQSGYMDKFIIGPYSQFILNIDDGICNGPDYNFVTGYKTYNEEDRNKWLYFGEKDSGGFLMGSYNIGDLNSNGYGVHRAFTDLQHAQNYSNELKNDKEYMQEVAEHHARSDDMEDFWDHED